MAFQLNELPPGVSWVRKLNASEAVEQCKIVGIQPEPTLEANRVLLRNFLEKFACGGAAGALPADDSPWGSVVADLPRDGVPKAAEIASVAEDHGLHQTQQPCAGAAVGAGSSPSLSQQWQRMVAETAAAVGASVAQALGHHRAESPGPAAVGNSSRVLQDLVSRIPLTNGSDPRKLVEFLVQVEKAQQLRLADPHSLVLFILPRTAGQLRVAWTRAISEGLQIQEVTRSVLEFFVPHRLRHSLASDLIYRTQRQDEPLLDFLSEVQDSAALLVPDLSGQDLLETALTGINQSTRSRLAGFQPPTSIEDLVALAPRVEIISGQSQREVTAPLQPRQLQFRRENYWRSDPRQNWVSGPGGRQSFRSHFQNSPARNDGGFRPGHHGASSGPQVPRHQNFRQSGPGSFSHVQPSAGASRQLNSQGGRR